MQSTLSIRTATVADAEMLTEFARHTFYEAFAPLIAPETCVLNCMRGDAPVEIVRFYVDRQFHGAGIAQTLMQACFDHAKQSGHQTIFLGVWEHNPRAIAFYRKWAFQIVGSHVFQMGDEAQNDFWMAREFETSIS